MESDSRRDGSGRHPEISAELSASDLADIGESPDQALYKPVPAKLDRPTPPGSIPTPFAGRETLSEVLGLSPPRRTGTDRRPVAHYLEVLGCKVADASADYGAQTVADQLVPADGTGGPGQAFPLVQAASNIDAVSGLLQSAAASAFEQLGTGIGLTAGEATVGAGMCTNLVLAPITGPLTDASTFLEIAGVAVGLMTGAHPLILVCIKPLMHQELEHLLADGIADLIRGPHAALGHEPVVLSTILPPPVPPGMARPPVMDRYVAERRVKVRMRDDASTFPDAPHEDLLWLCLGFALRQPEPSEAPTAAGGAADVAEQIGKVVVLPAGDDEFLESLPDILRRSHVREVDVPTAKATGDLPAGRHLVLRMDGVGLGTSSRSSGSQHAYQHSGCLTGHCAPSGHPPCSCPCPVCRNS